MPCHNPISCKPNGVDHMVVPCGHCEDCIQRKRSDWTIRLLAEEKYCSNAYFVTLTYSDKFVPIENGYFHLKKSDLQNLFKRYRRQTDKKNGKFASRVFKYYAIGEYGENTKRPHYHCILFNVDIEIFIDCWRRIVERFGVVNYCEPIGMIHCGDVTKQSINYVTSYVINKYKYSKRKKYPPFAIMSKGLGKAFVTRQMKKYFYNSFDTWITTEGGEKYAMPRYIKNKMFCPTAIKLMGKKANKKAIEKLKDDGYEKIINKRKYQRIVFKQSKKNKI